MIENTDAKNARHTTMNPNMSAQKKLTNVEMVKRAVAGFQGNQNFHIQWLVAKVNESFGVDLTLAQVKRAIPSHVKNVGDGRLITKGRAVRS